MRLYLDSSAIIYAIEGAPGFREPVLEHIAKAESSGGVILTCLLSRLECRVKPLRDQNSVLLSLYEEFFTRRNLEMIQITVSVIDRATELRVRYNFRTPDSLHLAAAIVAGADSFVTGDAALGRCAELSVQVL
jgi:uncharacterized protein